MTRTKTDTAPEEQVPGAAAFAHGEALAEEAVAKAEAGGFFKALGAARTMAKAADAFEAAANLGHVEAMYVLVRIYEAGAGVHKDPKQAKEWLFKAAEHGHREAQYNAAGLFMMLNAPGAKDKGIELFTSAAEQGHAKAQCILGGIHALGEHLPKDVEKAIEWYAKAADQGLVEAQRHLAHLVELRDEAI